MSHQAVLRHHPALSLLPAHVLGDLERIAVPSAHLRGMTIWSQGDRPSGMVVIRHGVAWLLRPLHGRGEIAFGLHGPSESIGDPWMLSGEPYACRACALSDVELLTIPRERVLAELRDHGPASLALATLLGRQAARLAEDAIRMTLPAGQRIARAALDLYEDFGDEVGEDGETQHMIQLGMTRADLARLAGVAEETAIRKLGEWSGLIALGQSGVVLSDLAKLKRLAET